MKSNFVFLLGYVKRKVMNESYIMVYLNVVRGNRYVGDRRKYMKNDEILVMTNNAKYISEMAEYPLNAVIEVRGEVVSRNINQVLHCSLCGSENIVIGTLTYVKPYFVKLRNAEKDQNEAYRFLKEAREISNQAYIFGTLCRDPKKLTLREDFPITQYQIETEEKYLDGHTVPKTTSTALWVKSYGDNALEDRMRLRFGSTVFIDGCLQQRSVLKHCRCSSCERIFDWYDKAMELVPFESEYLYNINSDENIKRNKESYYKQRISDLFGEDEITEEDMEEGFDSLLSD